MQQNKIHSPLIMTARYNNQVDRSDIFYKNVQEKNPLYLEFALRLASGDLVEFENEEDDVVINLKTKLH